MRNVSFIMTYNFKLDIIDCIKQHVANLWNSGIHIDWNKYNNSWKELKCLKKVSLPSYPLQKREYFFESVKEPASDEELSDEEDAKQFIIQWSKKSIEVSDDSDSTIYLLAAYSSQYAVELFTYIKRDSGIKCFGGELNLSDIYNKKKNTRHHLDLSFMLKQQCRTILVSWLGFSSLDQYCLWSSFMRSISQNNEPLRFIILVENTEINPYAAMISGSIKSLQKECPICDFVCIEVIPTEIGVEYFKTLCDLLKNRTLPPMLKYVNKIVMQPDFVVYKPDNDLNTRPSLSFVKNGVYIITGGLGGIGLEFAYYLAKNYQANIVLLSRRSVVNQSLWHDMLVEGIGGLEGLVLSKLNAIRLLANQLDVYSVDISLQQPLEQIYQKIVNKYGRVNGIIHAATAYPSGLYSQKKWCDTEESISTKIIGSRNIVSIIAENYPDFIMNFTALNTYTGTAGSIDYAAANAYLDAESIIHHADFGGLPNKLSVAWDSWNKVGLTDFKKYENSIFILLAKTKYKPFVFNHKLDDALLLVGSMLIDLIYAKIMDGLCHGSFVVFDKLIFKEPTYVICTDSYVIEIEQKHKNIHLYSHYFGDKSVEVVKAKYYCHSNAKKRYDLDFCIEKYLMMEDIEYPPYRPYKQNRIKVDDRWDCVQWVKNTGDTYFALLTSSSNYENESSNFLLNPSLFDIAYSYQIQYLNDIYLPFYIEGMEIYTELPANIYSLVIIDQLDESKGVCACSVEIYSLDSVLILKIEKIVFKRAMFNANSGYLQSSKLSVRNSTKAIEKVLKHNLPFSIISKSLDSIPNAGAYIKSNLSVDIEGSVIEEMCIAKRLRHAWRRVIGNVVLNEKSDFFEMGGDSLMAVDLSFLLHAQYNINISPADILLNSVFSDMERKVRDNSIGIN